MRKLLNGLAEYCFLASDKGFRLAADQYLMEAHTYNDHAFEIDALVANDMAQSEMEHIALPSNSCSPARATRQKDFSFASTVEVMGVLLILLILGTLSVLLCLITQAPRIGFMCAARTVTTGRLVPVRAMKHKCDANLYGVVARVFLSVGTMLSGPANPQFRRSGTKTSQASFPRFWELFGYVLPKSIRQKAYEPYVDELKQDYITARANPKNRRKWARRWLWLCFFVRTFATSVTCLRLFAVDSCWKWLFALLPSEVKDWFRRFTGR